MPDVFISYKRDDKAVAERIAKKLQKLGLDVWFDSRLSAGEAFDAGIESALREAKSVLALWSPASVGSEWVRNEASVGKERGVLVAAMIEPCEPPLAFRSTHYEALQGLRFGDDDASWGRIVERIQLLVGRHAEVAKLQRKRRTKAKRGRTFALLLAWVLALVPLWFAAIYVGDAWKPIYPASYQVSLDFWDRGYANASGTWKASGPWAIEDNLIISPVNYVKIDCDKSEGFCIEATGEVYKPGNILTVNTYRRPVITWDDNVIVLRDEFPKATRTITISRASQSVTALDERKCDGTAPDYCGPQNSRHELRLDDGMAVALKSDVGGGSLIGWIWSGATLAWTLFTAFRIFRVWKPKR